MWYSVRIFLKYLMNTLLLPSLLMWDQILSLWTTVPVLDQMIFTAISVKKKQHNTGSAVSEGEGRSQISLTI
jgi:hypothetical protein